MQIENPAQQAQVTAANMNVLDIKKMRDRAPFRPFQLHLTNGEMVPVQHPEQLSVPPEAETELFVVWVGAHWNLMDAGQVARVSLLDPGRNRPKT